MREKSMEYVEKQTKYSIMVKRKPKITEMFEIYEDEDVTSGT